MLKTLFFASAVLLITVAISAHSAGLDKPNAPVRVVADAQFIYRLQDPAKPDGLVTLRRSSRNDAQQVQIYPVPGLLNVSFYGNPMPIDVIQGKLQYVSLVPRERNQFDAGLCLIHPDELAKYPERFPTLDLRRIAPQDPAGIKGIGIVGIQAEQVVVHGGQLWFDILEESPRQYLDVVQFANSEGDILWIRRTNLLSEKLAERWTKSLPDDDTRLPGNLVGPFHLFRFKDSTYLLEADGAVSLFDDQKATFKKVGELRDLRRVNLSSKHVIFHDRAHENALYVLRRDEGGQLIPLKFTPDKSDQPNPFAEQLDDSLQKGLVAALQDVKDDGDGAVGKK